MRFPFRRRRTELRGAAWLSERLLLLAGRFDDAAMVVPFEDPMPPGGSDLEVPVGGRTTRIDAARLTRATTDLRTLVRRHLVGLDASTRQRLLDLVLEASHAELARTRSYSLAQNLNVLRNALREPMPRRVRTIHDRQAVHVERILAIDERSFWISGWAIDRAGGDPTVELVSPEGHRVDPLEGAIRHTRPDIDQFYAGAPALVPGVETGVKHGFVTYFELPSPSLIPSGWLIGLTDMGGPSLEEELPPVISDLFSVRHAVMNDLAGFADWRLDDDLLRRNAYPALTKLQDHLHKSTAVDTVRQFGTPSDSPEISVIVPLYGRIDFMEHQLCQFMHDPDFREIDLIYVLDSPELSNELGRYAAALYALYELPFRTATLSRNAGFAIANNLGATLARGRLLVLLNSDVVPDAPGWVRTMAAFYDATPEIGALGPKLLYEDGSLQHAGLYFDREAGSPMWTNLHYFKGLQSDFPPANVTRPVPAVTGACLMIERALWESVGGLSPAFVQGGYEDSDLCLRLLEQGRDNWYLPHVELHHLEDQSFPSEARRMATAYNTWLQTHLWGERIEALMTDQRYAAESQRALA